MSKTVHEVWDTDTYNLTGAYVGYEKAVTVASMLRKKAQRRVKIVDTGKTKAQYNADKKGILQ